MNFIDTAHLKISGAKHLGIRPENLNLSETGQLRGRVIHIEKLGGDTNIVVTLTTGETVTCRLFGQHDHEVGEEVTLGFDMNHAYLFDADEQRVNPH